MLLINPDAYKTVIKPLLFTLPPETAHTFAHLVLKCRPAWRAASPLLRTDNARMQVNLAGIPLRNPIGLAAGYDKECESLPALSDFGFGYITCGTITEAPRPGNPKPRIVRNPQDDALINSFGFPSKGLEHAARNLEQAQSWLGDAPIVASISGVAPDEIARCHARLEPLAVAIELNISCPNTIGLRVFQQPDALASLLDLLNRDRRKPLFVKLPPYLDLPSTGGEQKENVLALARVCVERGADALTIANTWPVRESRLAIGKGGLSGKPVFANMIQMVADIRAEVGDRIAINACGGIFSGEDALTAIDAGATTVQILTALMYRGPGIVRRINDQMLALMDADRVVALQ